MLLHKILFERRKLIRTFFVPIYYGHCCHRIIAHHFEYVYDIRVVWASEIYLQTTVARGHRKLGLAFFEYCFQVPANRWGFEHNVSPAQLKILTEAIALTVFIIFARYYFGETLKWNYVVSFALIFGAVFFAFAFR